MTAIEQSSLQRVEHARDAAYLQSYQRLQSALLGYKEALVGYKEALQKFEEGLNGEEPQSLKGQSLRLLSLGEVCQGLGADRASIYQLLIDREVRCYKLEDELRIRQADLEEYMEAR
jgi:excisionase family DNA binding protein